MNWFATICLLLSLQAPTAPPKVVFDNFGPGIRDQVKKADADARRNPRDAKTIGHLGMVLQTYDDHELAAACYTRARNLAPNEFRWAYLLGVSQMALGRQREAARTLREALRLKPADLPAQLKLADALLATGEWTESRALYESLCVRHGDLAQAWYGLGRIAAAQRNPAAAAEALRKAIERFPQYGAAHFALAAALRNLGDSVKVSEHLALAQQFKTVRPPLADPFLREVAELNQGATERIRKGIELEAAGRLDESIAEHERALEINPQLTQAHINLIQLYGRTNNAAKAEEHYRAVIALDPDLAEGHYNYGVMLAAQKRLPEAAEAFRRAVEINPQFADAQMNYGAALEAQKQYDEALKHYRLAVENKPNHREAHFQLARMLIFKGELPEAIRHLQRTLTPEDEQTPRYTYALAAAYARAGDRANGLKHLRLARDRAAALKQPELLARIERDLKTLEEGK
jgi:tetratricopeptide (TPR) repeat protein